MFHSLEYTSCQGAVFILSVTLYAAIAVVLSKSNCAYYITRSKNIKRLKKNTFKKHCYVSSKFLTTTPFILTNEKIRHTSFEVHRILVKPSFGVRTQTDCFYFFILSISMLRYFCLVASPPRIWRSDLFFSRTSLTSL